VAQMVTTIIEDILKEEFPEKNLGSLTGPAWKEKRTIFQKDITPPQVAQSYLPLLHEAIRGLADHMPEIIELPECFVLCSIDLFHSILFGTSIKPFDGPWEKNKWYPFVSKGDNIFPLLLKYIQSVEEEKPALQKQIREIYKYLIGLTKEEFSKCMENIDEVEKYPVKPYFPRLYEQGHISGKSAETSSFLIAALDTTAYALAWLFYNLGTSPLAQEKLYDEVNRVLKGELLKEEHLKSVPYLRACLKESFRLNNVVTSNVRILDTDIELQNYNIKAGTMITLSTIPYCLDESVFKNSDEYIPDRWLDEGNNKGLHNHPYMILPFGIGARMCLGARAAETEMMGLITAVLQRYRFEVVPSTEPRRILTDSTSKLRPKPKYKFYPRK